MDIMGHADISTTMDIYAECTKEKKKEGKGQILRPTPNTAPLICGACYNTQPEDLLTMA